MECIYNNKRFAKLNSGLAFDKVLIFRSQLWPWASIARLELEFNLAFYWMIHLHREREVLHIELDDLFRKLASERACSKQVEGTHFVRLGVLMDKSGGGGKKSVHRVVLVAATAPLLAVL